MLELDGSDAGGQFVRSAVALAALTDTTVEIQGIRGSRPEPGLNPQHCTAVETTAAICDATVEGVAQGSETLGFDPGEPTGGTYEADIGTAGSIPLLFDTVLPLSLAIDEPLSLRAHGGTDVTWAPPMAFHRQVKLPRLRRHGLQATVDRDRTGYYPVGGGEATLHLAPATLRPLALSDRGELAGVRIYSRASTDLADADVAARQATAAAERLATADLPVHERTVSYADADCPGSACVVRADYGESVAGFSTLGEKGKPAEDVGRAAVEDFLAFTETGAAVDRHLADQLLVFLAVGGGEVAVPAVTEHVATSCDLLAAFGYEVSVEERQNKTVLRGRGGRQ